MSPLDSGPDCSAGADDFARAMEGVALELLGPPHEKHLGGREWRYGSRGSLSIRVDLGTFFNHETGESGGTLDFVMSQVRTDKAGALAWLRERGHLAKNTSQKPASKRLVATYDYTDAEGRLLYQVVRYAPKTFRQRRPDGRGGWLWKMDGVQLVPYGLPAVLSAIRAGEPAFVVEGEKGVEALMALGITATCSPGGAGKWRDDYAAWLHGADVIVLPDNDEVGRRHAAMVAASLRGKASRVRVLELPDLPPKGDVADWIATGGTAAALEALVDEQAQGPQPEKPKPEPDADELVRWSEGAWDEASLPVRPWIARGYLMRRQVTVVGGAGAAGKSMLMLGYAVALVLHKEWGQFAPAQPCRVVVLNAEDDDDEQRLRLSATLRQHGRTPADLVGKLARVSLPTGAYLVHYDEASGRALPTEAFAKLEERIELFKPDAIELDPLVELHNGPETNEALRSVCAVFRGLARKHNCAVMLAHHVRKGSSEAAGDPDIIRGGGSLVGLSRVALTVVTMTADEAAALGQPVEHRRSFFRVDSAKGNYSAARVAAWHERVEHKLENGELVAAAHPWTPPADRVTFDDCLGLLEAVARGHEGEPLSPKLDKYPRSFRQACVQAGIETTAGQTEALRLLKRDHGVVEGAWSRAGRSQAQTWKGLRTKDGKPENVQWQD